jgi:hypothetical protein
MTIDVVVTERATGDEVERIACHSEHDANGVIRGLYNMMSPLSVATRRVTTMPHKMTDNEAAALIMSLEV